MTASALPGPGRYSVYTGRVTNWPLVVAVGVAPMLPLLLLGGLSRGGWLEPGGPAIPLLVATIVALVNLATGMSVRATAGPNGVSAYCGAVGWPRRTYRLAEIAYAEVADLAPSLSRLSFGFWWTPRHTYFTVRNGPSLRLVLRSGRNVFVTVPDPGAAVGMLRAAGVTSPR
ncbi:hypothetical protein AB0J83_22760 [Actinoplanes sp. NPDC049596]|uniref:hypothetical protein n=1 Tax=unclassified Actinoplanes TaxID=2626549 RepID=UPI003439B9C8